MPLETAEAAVVIVGVVPDRWWRATGDDAPGATGTRTRGFHRVFVVIAAWLLWQQAFVVAEDRAVLAVLERPVANDSRQRVPCLRRQEGGQGIAWSIPGAAVPTVAGRFAVAGSGVRCCCHHAIATISTQTRLSSFVMRMGGTREAATGAGAHSVIVAPAYARPSAIGAVDACLQRHCR